MTTPPWYVLTGAPHAGSGTLLNELALLGYHTCPEAARTVINRYRIEGISLQELRGSRQAKKKFQIEVLDAKINVEKSLRKDEIVFLERGIPDSIPYYEECGLKVTDELIKLSPGRYRKIFFLHQIPNYRKDEARIEDEDVAIKLGNKIKAVYQHFKYDVVEIPVAYPRIRMQLVLDEITSSST